MDKKSFVESVNKNTDHVYVRVSTSGLKRKALLMEDLNKNLHALAAKSELYGKILISGDPIEYDEED